MKQSKIVYSLCVADIQTVALETIERKLSIEEIEKSIASIEEKINWFDAIADSIRENIELKSC